MLEIDYLIKLVSETAEGKDNIKEGAVGSNGYGFVFRNFDYGSQDSFLIGDGSSKFSSIGPLKDIYKKIIEQQETAENIEELLHYDRKSDLYFGGALKTLVPDIEFGGDECLFDVWMFVKTPQGKMFPATLYSGVSGTTVGAWRPDFRVFLFTDAREFPQELKKVVNFNPFKFSDIKKEEFLEALEFALARVPVSDFEGIVRHDFGYDLMGVRSGQPFVIPLTKEEYRKLRKVETWSYSIMGNNEASSLACDFIEIKNSYIDPEEDQKHPKEIPKSLQRVLIERSYEGLVSHAYKKKSRLAFMVLGCFLMQRKSRITEELRHEILKYSDWEYEKDQLKNEKDRKERKKFLSDFREKIKNYDGSKKVKVPFYTVTRVINEKKAKGDTSPIWRHNIDYSIDN